MTCIVAVVNKGTVYMGADSLGAAQSHILTRKDPKVFVRKPFVFGFTSSFRMGQLLAHSLRVPCLPKKGITYKWMCTEFIDAVRKCLGEGGWKIKKDEQERGGTFLVGIAGQLFEIEGDFQVGIPGYDYAAVGCGQSYAKGSLYSTKHLQPRIRIRKALEAAEEFSGWVRRPFRIVKI